MCLGRPLRLRESAMLFCLRGRAEPAQPVERSLENEGGRHSIDGSRALGTGDVQRDQRPGDGSCRKPFIPKDARARRKRTKIAREGARRLRARTFRSIHIERQADDERRGVKFIHERDEPRRVLGKFRAPDRDKRRCDPPLHVGERKADSLGAEIGADERCPAPMRRAKSSSSKTSAAIKRPLIHNFVYIYFVYN